MGEVITLNLDNWLTLKALKNSLNILEERKDTKDKLNIKYLKEHFKHFLTNPD